jgi:hypothetical protein
MTAFRKSEATCGLRNPEKKLRGNANGKREGFLYALQGITRQILSAYSDQDHKASTKEVV